MIGREEGREERKERGREEKWKEPEQAWESRPVVPTLRRPRHVD